METKQAGKFKSALNFGTVLGLILMIISLIIYVFKLYEANLWLSWLSMAILAAGIYMGIKSFRDKARGGYISFGDALGYGVLVALFAGIISSIISYIYLGYIDDGFVQYQLTLQEDEMYNSGLPEEQIEMSLKYTKMFMQPGVLALMGVFMNTLIGFFISLVCAAILKKESEEFQG